MNTNNLQLSQLIKMNEMNPNHMIQTKQTHQIYKKKKAIINKHIETKRKGKICFLPKMI
jgi:hypothetical protein